MGKPPTPVPLRKTAESFYAAKVGDRSHFDRGTWFLAVPTTAPEVRDLATDEWR